MFERTLADALKKTYQYPLCTLSWYYNELDIKDTSRLNKRFGLTCIELSEIITKEMRDKGYTSYNLFSLRKKYNYSILNHCINISQNNDRIFLCEPAFRQKEPADITDVIGKSDRNISIKHYSELGEREFVIIGNPKGFSLKFYFPSRNAKESVPVIYDYDFFNSDSKSQKTERPIILKLFPQFNVFHMSKEKVRFASVFFLSNDFSMMGYNGKNTSFEDEENIPIFLENMGITSFDEVKEYVYRNVDFLKRYI